MPQASKGLRLSEAITLITMIFIGLALLIPAIMRIRETANLMQCRKNLRDIATATQNYHIDHNEGPSGYYGPVRSHGNNTAYEDDRGPHAGVLVQLLPYLQHEGLYRSLISPPTTWRPLGPPTSVAVGFIAGKDVEQKAWWTEAGNLLPHTGQLLIKTFICPSDADKETVAKGMVRLHIANGKFTQSAYPWANTLGMTNYLGVAGAAGDFDDAGEQPVIWKQWRGVMYNRASLYYGFTYHYKGVSHTLLFGESLGSIQADVRDMAFTWFGCGALGTAYGLGKGNLPGARQAPELGAVPSLENHGATWYRFGSRHRAGVHFAFGDASVRLLRFGQTTTPDLSNQGDNDSDWAVLQQLAGLNCPFQSKSVSIIEE